MSGALSFATLFIAVFASLLAVIAGLGIMWSMERGRKSRVHSAKQASPVRNTTDIAH